MNTTVRKWLLPGITFTLLFAGWLYGRSDQILAENGVLSAGPAIAGKAGADTATDVEDRRMAELHPPKLSIAEAKDLLGQSVTLQGVVTADSIAIEGGKPSVYVQDDTGGIPVFPSAPVNLRKGDLVRVTGKIEESNGLLQIKPGTDGVAVLQFDGPVPEVRSATLAAIREARYAEALEGRLVKLAGYVRHLADSPAGEGYDMTLIDDDSNSFTVRVMTDAMDPSAVQQGKWYEITGIISKSEIYRIIPRTANDLKSIEPQPPAPSALGK